MVPAWLPKSRHPSTYLAEADGGTVTEEASFGSFPMGMESGFWSARQLCAAYGRCGLARTSARE
jgi:hypothetical protein